MKVQVNFQAKRRGDLASDCADQAPQIIIHMIKIFEVDSPKDREHWIDEIVGFIKGKHAIPKEGKFSYNWYLAWKDPVEKDLILHYVSKLNRSKKYNIDLNKVDYLGISEAISELSSNLDTLHSSKYKRKKLLSDQEIRDCILEAIKEGMD